MADKNITEVGTVVGARGGVAPQQKLRSKKGHERRTNGAIYTVLTVMSIVWLVPFVFLVLQSFRSYKLEKGGMVDYLLPKTFSLDNYAFLFEGGNFFSWCGRAILVGLAVAVVTGALIHAAGKLLDRRDKASRGARPGLLGGSLAIGFALRLGRTAAVEGFAPAGKPVVTLIALALFLLVGGLIARVYLKQDSKLLRSIPGYVVEDRHEGAKKMAAMLAEIGVLAILLQYMLAPMEKSQYVRWYTNTLTIALFTSVLQTAIVLSVSYALSRLRFKGRKLIMNTVLVLGLFPGFLTMITLYFLLKQMGLTQAGAVPGLILIYCAS